MHFSIKELIIVLIIVALVFGTKKLRGIGSDLGSAIKGFRSAMHEGEHEADPVQEHKAEPEPIASAQQQQSADRVADAQPGEKQESNSGDPS